MLNHIYNQSFDLNNMLLEETATTPEIVIPSYYSLIDEGFETPVKSQFSGTCWAVAATYSMESSYKRKYGSDIVIDPISIVDSVYVDGVEEGFVLDVRNDKYDYGGESDQVIAAISKGDGEYYLTEAEWIDSGDRDALKRNIMTVGSICVDINPSTVTKLADRGSAQVVGIVTDVGAFLPVLYNALHDD